MANTTHTQKEGLWTAVLALFQDIKDPKTLLIRALTMFVALVGYFIISNEEEIVNYAKNFSRENVLAEARREAEANYVTTAKDKAATLYVQSRADLVTIVGYRPKFVNDFADIVAAEGNVAIGQTNLTGSFIDRTSLSYQQHLLGKNAHYDFTVEEDWDNTGFITDGKEYTSMGIHYIYTCPIFNLDNLYAGYIGFGFKEKPITEETSFEEVDTFLSRLCAPQARALGRKK